MRLFGRFGRALRGAIAGITRLRRRAGPSSTPRPAAPQSAQAPGAPRQARAPRRPAAAAQPAPIRSGWIARCFGRHGRPATAPRGPEFPDDGSPDFTPEKHPHLSPQACAILNTPAQDLPPEILHLLLTAVARGIAEQLPPELGLSDPQTLFSGLWTLLAAPIDEVIDEVSDATSAQASDAQPEVAVMPPLQPSGVPASAVPERAATAAPPVRPEIAVPSQCGRQRRRLNRQGGRQSLHGRRRGSNRGVREVRQHRPPAWRAYYACAGPP